MRNRILFVCFLFFTPFQLFTENLKNVLILTYNNIEKDQNFTYLETSIEDAIRNMLQKKFAFAQTPREEWEKIAKDNYIFNGEYYTKSASINLGLLARQDIVISGGFTISKAKKEKQTGKKEEISPEIIIINTRMYDVSKREIIAEFDVEGPASNKIFNSIQIVANNVSEAAKRVLPNKEEWEKMGLSAKKNLVIFKEPVIGLRLGGGGYMFGYADEFTSNQPFIGGFLRFYVPVIDSRFSLQAQWENYSHNLEPAKKSNLYGLKI